MLRRTGIFLALSALAVSSTLGSRASAFSKIVLTNDDGWAVALIRAQNNALKAAGYDVVLSCPAINKSGTGSSTTTPTVVTDGCEFSSCPRGSPPTGFNASDPRLNYVNAFPVDSARFGIQTLAPRFFGSAPDLVVAGPNIGNNLGSTVMISGTVGAATEAAKEGIPSVAFSASGDSTSQISYTTLSSAPASALTQSALMYAALTTAFTNALLASPATPVLPPNITLNVNYPACAAPADFKFVFSRIFVDAGATDVERCGTEHLPDETTVVGTAGCFASVSVMDAVTKSDVDPATQGVVLDRIGSSFFTCLP